MLVMKVFNFGGKSYRPFNYEEAKEKLLGKAVEFIYEEECEDCGDIHEYPTSFLVTRVDDEGICVGDSPLIPYTHALVMFNMNGHPLGVEVEVKDVEPKKAKPASTTTSAKKSPRKKRETKAKAEE